MVRSDDRVARFSDMERHMATRIRHLRWDSGKTKVAMSADTRLSRQFIGRLESGKSLPSIRNLEVLAIYFGVSIEFFINGTGLTRQLRDPVQRLRSGPSASGVNAAGANL